MNFDYYWKDDINCVMCTLGILGEVFSIDLTPQVLDPAIGLNGTGKYQAQCGLVEGTLMFIGILGKQRKVPYETIKKLCYAKKPTPIPEKCRCPKSHNSGFCF